MVLPLLLVDPMSHRLPRLPSARVHRQILRRDLERLAPLPDGDGTPPRPSLARSTSADRRILSHLFLCPPLPFSPRALVKAVSVPI